jgi:23S rRNA (adenine2030-N6)-methyltransferase
MLSYQHGYHAGNFADVLKHLILCQTISYFRQKNKPLCYIDTHAGQGMYQMNSPEAQKNKEYLTGIGQLWDKPELPVPVADYVKIIRLFNQSGQLSHYPGSPSIAVKLLGSQDRLFCFELHPKENFYLNRVLKQDKRVKVLFSNGFTDSIGMMPPKERRGIILIDPSYELKNEYQLVITAITAMYKRFANACYLLWYPVVDRSRNRFLERALKTSGIGNIQLYELGIKQENAELGMTGSGMIVINPPWTLKANMQACLPWLSEVLGYEGQGTYRIEQIAEE